jgi:Helix-turn-helix domain
MDLRQFLSEHAISDEIGGHGRYVRFEKGEIDLVVSYFADFDKKVQGLAKIVAGQSGGFVILRRGWGSAAPPQLRPDEAVYTSNLRTPSYHPSHADAGLVFHKTTSGKTIKVRPLPPRASELHRTKWHPDGNVEHLHFHRRKAKYVLPPGSHGKRLDVPDPERILRADRVFFVIEGSLKTDAIRSTGEAAFGVPSVTLWDAPELGDFIRAMNLREKQVVIVPDADWCNNPLVIAQAMLCFVYLLDRGVGRALVAAPPWVGAALDQNGDQRECECSPGTTITSDGYCPSCGRFYKGVDDYLRAGGKLDDLAVLEREPVDPMSVWKALNPYCHHIKAWMRSSRALEILPLFAEKNGELFKSISMFAKILGRSRDTARKAIEDLARAGTIEVEGSLDADFQYEDPNDGSLHDYDWDERPRIRIAPEFRVIENPVALRERPAIKNPNSEVRHLVESRAC